MSDDNCIYVWGNLETVMPLHNLPTRVPIKYSVGCLTQYKYYNEN